MWPEEPRAAPRKRFRVWFIAADEAGQSSTKQLILEGLAVLGWGGSAHTSKATSRLYLLLLGQNPTSPLTLRLLEGQQGPKSGAVGGHRWISRDLNLFKFRFRWRRSRRGTQSSLRTGAGAVA